MSDLHPARRGRFTRGTRIAWDTLATWLEGAAVLHNRLCSSRDVRDACARHGIALAEELELVAVASRTDLDKLLQLLGPTDSGVWGMRDPLVREAREKVMAAAADRDRHLRRLDGDPEIGIRRRWTILLLHFGGVREMFTEPTVRADLAAVKALQQYRADFIREVGPVLLVAGFDRIEFFGRGDGLKVTPEVRELLQPPRLPWHQTWRPEVRRWCAHLIERHLRTLGLIDYPQPGHVSATDLLFLPGRSETP